MPCTRARRFGLRLILGFALGAVASAALLATSCRHAAPSGSAPQPDDALSPEAALEQARKWQSDAELVEVGVAEVHGVQQEPGGQIITYYFRSPSTGQGYVIMNGQGSPAVLGSSGTGFSPPFIDYSKAVEAAHKAGLKGDPGSGVLSVVRQQGQPVRLTWQLGNYRIDAISGQALAQAQPITNYANPYNKAWDEARQSGILAAWSKCATRTYQTYNATAYHAGQTASEQQLLFGRNDTITVAGPVAQFRCVYQAPGVDAPFMVIVPTRPAASDEPYRNLYSLRILDPPNFAYVVNVASKPPPRGVQIDRLRQQLHDTYNGNCVCH